MGGAPSREVFRSAGATVCVRPRRHGSRAPCRYSCCGSTRWYAHTCALPPGSDGRQPSSTRLLRNRITRKYAYIILGIILSYTVLLCSRCIFLHNRHNMRNRYLYHARRRLTVQRDKKNGCRLKPDTLKLLWRVPNFQNSIIIVINIYDSTILYGIIVCTSCGTKLVCWVLGLVVFRGWWMH